MKKTIIALMALAGVAAADSITLNIPGNPATNDGEGGTSAEAALVKFTRDTDTDGGYMFNNGGACGTNVETGEGILSTVDGVTSLTLCPRAGAGGSGEVIVLSGTSELANYEVSAFTFNITSSSSANITGTVALTLAVIENDGGEWSVLKSDTGSLTIGSGSSVTLTLSESITWDSSYKVVAMVDNTGKTLAGGNGNPYTLSGISITAEATAAAVPEPATATLSLLALAGLAARRRRK